MGLVSDIIRRKYGLPEQHPKSKKTPAEIEAEQKAIADYNKKVFREKQTHQLQISSKELKKIFVKVAQKTFMNDKPFIIDNENEYFINTIVMYFANDERFLQSKLITNKPCLKKGLLITGTTGYGKTMVMRIIQKVFAPINSESYSKKIRIQSCNEIVNNYNVSGAESLQKYFKQGNYLFDDFGTENTAKFYGLTENVMKTILEERYNLFVDKRKATHLTSNLSIAEINQKYGFRVESRLNEMFNIIKVNGKDRRKQ